MLFKKDEIEYIYANYKGVGPTEMHERINSIFNANYSRSQIKSFYLNNKLTSGVDSKYKAGHRPPSSLPIGTIKEWHSHKSIKVSMQPNQYQWMALSRYLWEKAHGSVPTGMMVVRKDGDTSNYDVDNFALVTNREWIKMCKLGLHQGCAETFEQRLALARLCITRTEAIRGRKKKLEDGKKEPI